MSKVKTNGFHWLQSNAFSHYCGKLENFANTHHLDLIFGVQNCDWTNFLQTTSGERGVGGDGGDEDGDGDSDGDGGYSDGWL